MTIVVVLVVSLSLWIAVSVKRDTSSFGLGLLLWVADTGAIVVEICVFGWSVGESTR